MSAKELKLFIDGVHSGVARLMLQDGAVFEFPAALLPEGAREGCGLTMRLALDGAGDYKDEIDSLLDSLGDSL